MRCFAEDCLGMLLRDLSDPFVLLKQLICPKNRLSCYLITNRVFIHPKQTLPVILLHLRPVKTLERADKTVSSMLTVSAQLLHTHPSPKSFGGKSCSVVSNKDDIEIPE